MIEKYCEKNKIDKESYCPPSKEIQKLKYNI
jgi:hypothetical protein